MNIIVVGYVCDQIDVVDVGKRFNYVVVDSMGCGFSGLINVVVCWQMMGMDYVVKVYEWLQVGLFCDDDNGFLQIVWVMVQIFDVFFVVVVFDGFIRLVWLGEVIVLDVVNGYDFKVLLGMMINVLYQCKMKVFEVEVVLMKFKVVGFYDFSCMNNDGFDMVYVNVDDVKNWEVVNVGMFF